jgi:hypothetical protein
MAVGKRGMGRAGGGVVEGRGYVVEAGKDEIIGEARGMVRILHAILVFSCEVFKEVGISLDKVPHHFMGRHHSLLFLDPAFFSTGNKQQMQWCILVITSL